MTQTADHAKTYAREFWDARNAAAARSAKAGVPLLVEAFSPTSIVDVGCGRGHWLAAFRDLGIEDVYGIDGPGVLQNSSLLIPRERFVEQDLTRSFISNRRYDLALCLEVAEHLPPGSGPELVRTLTGLADVVIFSAAIPGQGGVGHVNERWPWYWRERFEERGFQQHDCFRHRIWHDPNFATWYKQNLFAYAKPEMRSRFPQALGPFECGELTLIASDTLYRLSRPSIIKRMSNRLSQAFGPS